VLVTIDLPAIAVHRGRTDPDVRNLQRAHVRAVGQSLPTPVPQIALGVTFLAYQAWR